MRQVVCDHEDRETYTYVHMQCIHSLMSIWLIPICVIPSYTHTVIPPFWHAWPSPTAGENHLAAQPQLPGQPGRPGAPHCQGALRLPCEGSGRSSLCVCCELPLPILPLHSLPPSLPPSALHCFIMYSLSLSLPPSLPPSLHPSIPPSLCSSIPSYLHPSVPPFLHTFITPSFHSSVPPSLPPSLQASTLEEINIRRGERVEILNDSRNWWLVKNYLGATGYLPSNLLEVIIPKKKSACELGGREKLPRKRGREGERERGREERRERNARNER